MSKLKLKNLKQVTRVAAPVERTVKWMTEATAENIDFLKEQTGNTELSTGDLVEIEGQVFIKRLSFNAKRELDKAFEWDIDYEDISNSKVKSIDHRLLQAAQLMGTVCEDTNGATFFDSVDDVLESDPAFIDALYAVADEVVNFMGKLAKKSSEKMNSGASLSSTASEEQPLNQPNDVSTPMNLPFGGNTAAEEAASASVDESNKPSQT